jgi:hypothetical protein
MRNRAEDEYSKRAKSKLTMINIFWKNKCAIFLPLCLILNSSLSKVYDGEEMRRN